MTAVLARARQWWPGTALSVVIALAATFVSTLHGGPQLLYALFFGVAFHYLSQEPSTRPGIEFCSRHVLRLGVGLLGARITGAQIISLGWATAALVITGVVTTILGGRLLARRLGMSSAQGVLSGGSVAICGASAALAISSVLPRDKESERFTLLVVVTVTAMSTLAMVIYPLIARLLHLEPRWAGLFLGGTIHDVAQVVGAGYTLGHDAGDFAAIVKLFRVAMLALVVVAVAAAFPRAAAATPTDPRVQRPPLVPGFLWVFMALVAANSMDLLAAPVEAGLGWLSRACLVVAIAALGMKTSFAELARAGWRPFGLILAETLWLATLVLAGILLLR
jgi:uncharacterized integral membrane protein (TIGR00698 family)